METSTLGDADWKAHASALRRLALGLVRDGNDADELVQEVWLRAQGDASRSRGWFTVTLRNLVADRARARARRTAHERAVARAEPVPSAEAILEQLEIAEELARELARVAEPYRLVLHLRYFEDLAPDEIAARLGEPRETVRTRLRRALAELRERMDRAHGGERRAWALALAPLSGERAGTGAPLALAASIATWIGGIAMGTKVVAGAAVLAAAVVVTWWARGADDVTAEAPVLAARPAELAAPVSPGAGAEPGRREPLAAPDAEVPDARGTAAPALTAPDAREVEVRVVVLDEQGAELARESGTLTVGLVEEVGKGDVLEIAFEDGVATLAVPDGRRVVFGRLVARGREATLPELVPVEPGDEPLFVRGRWLPRGSLRVIDADTQQDLAGVEVRHAQGWRAIPSWNHPGDHSSLTVTRGTSPVALPERTWPSPYWVHAPEHAWTRVYFDHATGGTRTVELSRERGTVELTCTGMPPAETHARLYGPGSTARPVLELRSYEAAVSVHLATPGPTRIEDLAPGRYVAVLETGEYEERVHIGPPVELELVSGGTASIVLELDSAPLTPSTTHLLGTLRVQAELLAGRHHLRLERLDRGQADILLPLGDMDESEDDETLLLWDAGEVRTGTYLANLPLQFRVKLEADVAGGETRVALEMPPVGTVTVEVVDAASGAPLVPKRLSWAVGPLEAISHSTRRSMDERAADGTWRFLAPHGRIDVSASQPGYMDADETLELAGPEARVRLALRRAMGVRFLLRDGDAAVNPDFAWFFGVRLRAADGTPAADHRSIAGEIASRSVREPGTYTLSFPPLDGFRQIPERTVEIGRDEVVDVIVPLESD